jgi:hypothetical protein
LFASLQAEVLNLFAFDAFEDGEVTAATLSNISYTSLHIQRGNTLKQKGSLAARRNKDQDHVKF